MTNEFDERFLDEFPLFRHRRNHVQHRVNGELGRNFDRLYDLADSRAATESRQTLVPDSSQQLLHVCVSHKLWRVRFRLGCVLK